MPRTYVSTAEKRREESRRNILDAAIDLFFTKGYQKTTTRDIIVRAGILNGSLYNRFRNKEEILYTIVEEALQDALGQLTDRLEKEKNPAIALALPVAVELYISSKDEKIAELLYEVHRSWADLNEYVRMYMQWADAQMEKFGMSVSEDPWSGTKVMAMMGAIGNIVGSYANGGRADYRAILVQVIGIWCTLFDFHVLDIQKLVDSLCGIVENEEITLLGHRLS